MFEFTYPQLLAWAGMFIWPFFRVSAFVATAPFLSETSIPIYVRLGLACFISVAVSPLIDHVPVVDMASYAAMGIMLEQMVIGAALGLTVKFIFASSSMAGELIGMQMGLSFAQMYDPANGGNTTVVSRLLTSITMLVFVAVNGHLLMISGLAKTFMMIPIGGQRVDMGGIAHLMAWSEQLFIAGIVLSMPMIVALLTVNLALGILNRTAQQLSVFSVGFPVTLSVSMIILAIMLPRMDYFLEALFLQGYEAMGNVANGFIPKSTR